MVSPEQKQVVEFEQRQSRIILVTTVLGVLAALAGQVMQTATLDTNADDDAERLLDRIDGFGTILTGSIIGALGYLLLAGTVFFLFTAAARRSASVRQTLKPLIIIGPVLLAASGVISVIAYDDVAGQFAAGMPTEGDAGVDRATDLISNSSLFQYALFGSLAGVMAFSFSIIYSGLWGMRTGLLTRFWGTLGMAFGAAFLLSAFLGPIGIFGIMLWLVHVAMVSRGKWAGGPLPAWEQGEAVPWPDPKAPPPEPEPEQAANPEDFEDSATEVRERPGRRDNKRKRKRKSRG